MVDLASWAITESSRKRRAERPRETQRVRGRPGQNFGRYRSRPDRSSRPALPSMIGTCSPVVSEKSRRLSTPLTAGGEMGMADPAPA